VVAIEGGRIASISSREASELPGVARVLDFPGATLAPSFFDVHIHGGAGHDAMEATPEALNAISSFLALHGTGNFLATTVTAPMDATLRSLSGLAKLLAAHATARGVRITMGHSFATAAETRALIAAGAVSATHTFNAMRPLDHREPGILGTVLTNDAVFADLICDGVHTAEETVKLWWRAKGPERAILITDAMSAAGMPDGEYQLGEMAVQVTNGYATANGVLAGSVLTLDRALENFVRFTGATVQQGLRLLTTNPAAMTGLGRQAGSLAVGQEANLVAVDGAGKMVAAMQGGQLVSR
jgi:N-acetylglucosamine-6-phosphate deacetylase